MHCYRIFNPHWFRILLCTVTPLEATLSRFFPGQPSARSEYLYHPASVIEWIKHLQHHHLFLLLSPPRGPVYHLSLFVLYFSDTFTHKHSVVASDGLFFFSLLQLWWTGEDKGKKSKWWGDSLSQSGQDKAVWYSDLAHGVIISLFWQFFLCFYLNLRFIDEKPIK